MNPLLIASTCLITQEQHCHMSTCHRAKILICFWAFYYVFHSPFFLARVLQLLGQAAEIPSISVLYIKRSIEISFTNVLSFSQTFLGFSYGISICKFHLYCQYARSILNMKKTKCFCNIFCALLFSFLDPGNTMLLKYAFF